MTVSMDQATLSIAAVERETRLSKDVLRVWEKRYGFPMPSRDAYGERCYPVEQVERLRLMKRLMDQGMRPGRLAQLSEAELARLAQGAVRRAAPPMEAAHAPLEALLSTVKHDPAAFQAALRQQLARLGLERFVEQLAAPLSAAVGARWEDGSFDIVDEHLYTEAMARALRHGLGALPEHTRPPRILLTTLPGEAHGLGLLMIEALLALDGAHCVGLGTETPPASIARAVRGHQADIVALSFSAAYPRRQVAASLQEVRRLLPAGVALWAGGAGACAAALADTEGLRLLPTLASGRQALAEWRLARQDPAG